MRLSVPIFNNDKVYTNAEILKPSGGVLADTRKEADKGDVFSSTRVFLVGCIESISTESETVTDKTALKGLIAKMPYKTAEQLVLEILKLYHGDEDEIEGLYRCPRCNHKIICELRVSEGMEIDNRDHLADLTVGYYEGNGIIDCDLTSPIILQNSLNGETIASVERFSMRFPTIENAIAAFQEYGLNDEVRLNYAMFANALVSVNGNPVDTRWKKLFGVAMFERMRELKKDLGGVASFINQFGVQPYVLKRCPECGKEFKAQINTSNFFVSALRQA